MRVFLSILIFYFTIFPAIAFAKAEDKGEQAPLPLVKVTEIVLENANPPEKYIGHVESIESIDLMARVEGYLEEINFKEGAFVKQGQLLYVIERPPYKARVAAAKARVVQAEADLFKAETRLQRLRSAKPESVPKTDLDDALAARDLAQGKLDEAKANLELANIDLGYTSIKAPVTGRIGKSLYKVGDLVGPSSQPLAEVIRMDPIRVVFSVSENRGGIIMSALQDAQREEADPILSVEVEFPDGKKYSQKGEIDFVNNKVDPNTGTIAIWAIFDNPKGRLVPGEYVRVFLGETKQKMVPVVPQAAVMRDQEGAFVYVVDEKDNVEHRRVKLGTSLDGKFIVSAGLAPGERVIVQGIQKVKPGITVKVEGE